MDYRNEGLKRDGGSLVFITGRRGKMAVGGAFSDCNLITSSSNVAAGEIMGEFFRL